MKRNAKVALVALGGAVVAAVVARFRKPVELPPLPDERAEELRRKLAEARAAAADQDDFQAAGMGAETIGEEEPPPKRPASTGERPPQDEFEAMRRRIHEEGKAAAEEMRRSADPPKDP
ncbi:MAG: hypothetical protein ACRDLZ_01820 [Gaiellaceae bacterium]